MNKCEMKAQITILSSTSSDYEDDTKFLAIMASRIIEDPLTAT